MSDGPALVEHRCSNHETREAVCRCPQCGRAYCKECVSEHEGRLICAACLRAAARASAARTRGRRRVAEIALTTAGIALAWAIFLGAAESVITITERAERVAWQER